MHGDGWTGAPCKIVVVRETCPTIPSNESEHEEAHYATHGTCCSTSSSGAGAVLGGAGELANFACHRHRGTRRHLHHLRSGTGENPDRHPWREGLGTIDPGTRPEHRPARDGYHPTGHGHHGTG